MKNFKEAMLAQQVRWRRNNLSHIKENGQQNGREYEHILPWEQGWQNFYPKIQSELKTYLKDNNIKAHTGIHNLLSSWVACANLYWPFRNNDGFILLGEYLGKATGIKINRIEGMELEYAEKEEDFQPQQLLGEDEGMRGSGQTSPDIAIKFLTIDKRKGIFLIESKFTEHSFYRCSGYSKTKPGKPVNPNNKRCHDMKQVVRSSFKDCHLTAPEWERKYWDLLKNHFNYKNLKICPMAKCCYQIFRQQALAKGLEKKYDISMSCVAVDSRNENLINSSLSVGLKPFPEGWKDVFPKLPFLWLTHNNWFDFVKSNNRDGKWNEWVDYIENRYFKINKN